MTHKTDTEIKFSGLKSGVYTFNFILDDAFFLEWKNEKIQGGNVAFDVRLERNERFMMFFFTFSGVVKTTCDRCLGEMTLPVEGEQELCVKFSDTEHSDDENVVFLPEKESTINLAQWMYEYVAVSIPIQCIHPDDENGNTTCDPEMMKYMTTEVQENEEQVVDPRWAALKALKEE